MLPACFCFAGLQLRAAAPQLKQSVSLYACGPFFTGPENHSVQVLLPPVTGLTASLVNNKEVQLQWELSDEKNILHFEIQHSTNGRSFSAVGIVKFKLNTEAEKAAYTFLHTQPVSGRNYYRIKTVYLNRSTEQSVIVPVQYSTDAKDRKEAVVFPNPSANGIVYFSTTSSRSAQYQLYVFDLDGKLVRQKLVQSNQTTILQQLSKGTYLFEIFKNDERIDSGQLIVR
ncbi:MAG: T9SS type A sorting domain-containing protein [Chitinophagaceae bacterium]